MRPCDWLACPIIVQLQENMNKSTNKNNKKDKKDKKNKKDEKNESKKEMRYRPTTRSDP